MADYTWCHGPNCHERRTTNRVRGVKGNKVLRTVKIRQRMVGPEIHVGNTFATRLVCMILLINTFEEFVRLHPRTEPLETPIEVEKVKHEGYDSRWGRIPDRTETKITVDNERNVG